jgi:hypothetical protein
VLLAAGVVAWLVTTGGGRFSRGNHR